jgi:hypothetical protein
MIYRVRLVPVYPPIPTRAYDWCALVDGEEENRQYGYGSTKQEAIEELFQLEENRQCGL